MVRVCVCVCWVCVRVCGCADASVLVLCFRACLPAWFDVGPCRSCVSVRAERLRMPPRAGRLLTTACGERDGDAEGCALPRLRLPPQGPERQWCWGAGAVRAIGSRTHWTALPCRRRPHLAAHSHTATPPLCRCADQPRMLESVRVVVVVVVVVCVCVWSMCGARASVPDVPVWLGLCD